MTQPASSALRTLHRGDRRVQRRGSGGRGGSLGPMATSALDDLGRFFAGVAPTRSNPPSADPSTPSGAAALVARFMRPERANEGAVWAASQRLPPGADGRALWEALVAEGALPAGWVDDNRRTFADRVRLEDTMSSDLLADLAQTPSRATAAALAADPGGVALAEDLVRECCARLAVFAPKGHEFHRIVASGDVAWEVGDPAAVLAMQTSNELPFIGVRVLILEYSADDALERGVAVKDALVERATRTNSALEEALRGRRVELGAKLAHNLVHVARFCGQFEVLRGSSERAPWSWGPTLRGTPFAELPNPWGPLLDLYRTGYAFHGFLMQSGWVPLLLCPRLTSGGTP